MNLKIMRNLLCWVATVGPVFSAAARAESKGCCGVGGAVKPLEAVLGDLSKKVEQLVSYEAQVEFIYSQPLLESETVRKGWLYYRKNGGRSKLRINFETLRQDDGEEQKYLEQFLFDGVWLVRIDYQTRQADFYQKAPENEPIDAFDLACEQVPIVGFARIEQLKQHFDITLPAPPSDCNDVSRLHLRVNAQSAYKDRYKYVELWIDRVTGLPRKIVAATIEGDIYDIRLHKSKFNKNIKPNIFEVAIPKDFSTKREPSPKQKATD
jgi:outer membrane lipoprotein-sorting protein